MANKKTSPVVPVFVFFRIKDPPWFQQLSSEQTVVSQPRSRAGGEERREGRLVSLEGDLGEPGKPAGLIAIDGLVRITGTLW